MCDKQKASVRGKEHAPRIGGPSVRIVQQDGMRPVRMRRINDSHGIRVHPAPVQLRRRHLVAAQHVRHGQVAAIRANGHAPHALRSVGQGEMNRLPVLNQGQRRRSEVPVRRACGQMVGRPYFLSVRGDGQGHRFTGGRPGIQHFSGRNVHFHNLGIESGGHIQFTIEHHRRHGRMPCREGTLHGSRVQSDHFHHASGAAFRHIGDISVNCHAVGLPGQADAFHHFPRTGVHQFQLFALMPQNGSQFSINLDIHRSHGTGPGVRFLPA